MNNLIVVFILSKFKMKICFNGLIIEQIYTNNEISLNKNKKLLKPGVLSNFRGFYS
jgi:hypothetical protein